MSFTVADMPSEDRFVDDDAPKTIRGNAHGADCANCPFGKFGKPNQPVFGEGWERPNFIVVGEGPGQNEVIQQRPFVGSSGRLVNETLSRLGIARESLWVSNSMLCVEGTTQVRLADGSLKRIDHLVANRYDGLVQSIDATGSVIAARVTNWYRNPRGTREMRDVSFRWAQRAGARGRTHAVLTEDHPVLTPEGWRPAADINGGWIATGDVAPAGRALQVAYGTLLGDGTLAKGSLVVTHAEDQKQYAMLKARVLKKFGVSLFQQPPRQNEQAKYGFRTAAGAWGHATRDLFYPEGKKRIPSTVLASADELLFAVWYLDDGYMQIRNGHRPLAEICGVAFPEPDLLHASAVLRARGFENRVRRGRIRFTVEGTARFSAAIATYVPPVMAYKLRPEDRGKYDPQTYEPIPAAAFYDQAESVCTSPRRKGEGATVYCLEVEGTHNFLTPGAVVHNCQPPHGASDAIKKQARQACGDRLKQEIAQFPGVPVLALGAHAAQQLTGNEKFSITQMAGSYHEVDCDNSGRTRAVIPSIHPAAILRGGGASGGGGSHTVDLAFWNLLYDTAKVNLISQGADIKFTDDIQVELEDWQRAKKLVADFVVDAYRSGRFACDTETFVENTKQHTALSPYNANMSALGLATFERAISIAWELCIPEVLEPLDKLFADESVVKIFHNRIYDVPVLERHGFQINGEIHCTMLMHHSAFPGLAHNLQRVLTQFYAAPPWKAEYRHGQGTLDELLPYNARDTLATARIEGPIALIIKESNAEKTYKVDLAMAHAASVMHMKGVPIDPEINGQLRKGFRANIDAAKKELDDKIQDPTILARFKERLAFEQARRTRKHDPIDLDERISKRLGEIEASKFNFMIDSGDHIVAFLKACGVPLSLQTASGRISTKKDVLEAFSQYPEIQALLNYRENAKLLSTFCERMLDRPVLDKEGRPIPGKIRYGFADPWLRVHPRWSVHAITGRWRSEGPQAQNWPKADKKKGRPNLRSQVVAPYGRAFVAFDAKQLEARLIALMSGDPFLLDIFHKDKDIHSEFARIVWPDFDTVPVDERKVRRDLIKRPEYGAFYAGSIETLWKAVVRDYPQVTIGMIGKMVQVMKTRMPGVTKWHQDMQRMADQQGEIRSMILGRRRCFPIKQFDLTEVVNFPIQASGADLINLGLADIMPLLPEGAWPILQIHDAVVFECDEDDQDLLKALVVKCFTREVEYNGNKMNFPVDAKAGKTWAEVN
jgi:DNA polymerase I-like protein with 3'-5' exonuclease and polymerase domains/uracil-DNA glycosylase